MAAALASLGVAASIAQFVSIGFKSAVFILKSYTAADDLVLDQQRLRAIAQDMEHCALRLGQQPTKINENLRSMLETSKELAKDLIQELEWLQRPNAGRRQRLLKSLRALWKRSEIEENKQKLLEIRDQIQLSLTASLWNFSQDLEIQLDTLSTDLHSVNAQLAVQLQNLAQEVEGLSKENSLEHDHLNEELSKVAIDVEKLLTCWANRQRVEYILKSLHFKAISERPSRIPQAHQDTFKWSLSEDMTSLAVWLREGHGIYWIEGKAGCGKSTLMKYLIGERATRKLLEKWAGSRHLVLASHFFWAYGTELQSGMEGLFRTLLFQILQEMPTVMDRIYPSRMDPNQFRHLESWTTEELVQGFQRLSTLSPLRAKFCIFIDGLDEFRGDHLDLVQVLQSIFKSTDIKLCVSSRPWLEFQRAFGQSRWQLHVHKLTKLDIEKYVHDHLTGSAHYQALESQYPVETQAFKKELSLKADGVFLWVYPVTRSLLRGLQYEDDISTLTRRLREFPRQLEDYFTSMLDSIEPVYWEETSRVLRMLIYARAPVRQDLLYDQQYLRNCINETSQELSLASERFKITEDYKSWKPKNQYNFRQWWMSEKKNEIKLLHLGSLSQRQRPLPISRCKDLVHSCDASGSSPNIPKVGFLHRTVCDFLNLQHVTARLDKRLGCEFDPGMAFAEGYFALFCSTAQVDWEQAKQYLLWVLFFNKDVSSKTKEKSEKMMLLLYVVCILFRPGKKRWDVQPTGVSSWPLVDGYTLNRLLMQNHGITKPLIPGLGRMSTDVVLAVLGGPGGPGGPRGHFPSAKKWWITKSLVIRDTDDSALILEQLDTMDLHLLEQEVSQRLPNSDFMGGFWLQILDCIIKTEPNDLPTNIYLACQLLISLGAPQYIQDRCSTMRGTAMSRFISTENGVEEETLGRIWDSARVGTKEGRKAVRGSKEEDSGERVFDTAWILDQIPQISSQCPNGAKELFKP